MREEGVIAEIAVRDANRNMSNELWKGGEIGLECGNLRSYLLKELETGIK